MHFIHIACSPCLHSGLCYLLGGNTDSCEVFQPIPETFTPLSLVLPETLYGCGVCPGPVCHIVDFLWDLLEAGACRYGGDKPGRGVERLEHFKAMHIWKLPV